jgi:hypothetical protein
VGVSPAATPERAGALSEKKLAGEKKRFFFALLRSIVFSKGSR